MANLSEPISGKYSGGGGVEQIPSKVFPEYENEDKNWRNGKKGKKLAVVVRAKKSPPTSRNLCFNTLPKLDF